MMVDRGDLEAKRAPAEMQALLLCFAKNREVYTDEDVHLRRGVVSFAVQGALVPAMSDRMLLLLGVLLVFTGLGWQRYRKADS